MPWLRHPATAVSIATLSVAGLLAARVAQAAPQPEPNSTRPDPHHPAAPAAGPALQTSGTAAVQTTAPPLPEFYIREFRVRGAHALTPEEIGNIVYPFEGPSRTKDDIENARAALQKAYEDQIHTAVQVEIPPQTGAGGVVFFTVHEITIGRLRVHGSRYYDIDEIKKEAPGLQEGKLINFDNIQRDVIALNQWQDRRITPSLHPGEAPDTMDVDLTVKDTLPLHGSVEFNNRYSVDTPPLRLDASLSYTNLWQLGHSIGGSLQISPQNADKVSVYNAFYTARIPGLDNFTFTMEVTKQNSDVSTLGGLDSVGRGDVIGFHGTFKLPNLTNYFQSLTFGFDYKDFRQDAIDMSTGVATELPHEPHTIYVPFTLDYSGTWVSNPDTTKYNSLTDLDITAIFNIRGIGSAESSFEDNRFKAERDFAYLRASLSETQDLPMDLQVFAKISGQLASGPLLNSEEFSAGGYDTVRGYLESEVQGDNAAVFNFEFRSPSLLSWVKGVDPKKPSDEWRLYFFTDAAAVGLDDSLPGQADRYSLASFGGGTRMTLADHFNGSLDLAIPLFNQTTTKAHHAFLQFRVWADF